MDEEKHAMEIQLNDPELASAPSRSMPLVPPATLDQVRERTPARILAGRAGPAYRTATWLKLRSDHAAARDAVYAELELNGDLGPSFVTKWGLFEVATLAHTKEEFLRRPELGRSLSDVAKIELAHRCSYRPDLQVAITDGLSSEAVRTQVPELLPLLVAEANRRSWHFGQPFFIRHGRVGLLNDIGEVLDPAVAVLLIGERPGLATAQSLSAYMAYHPRASHDDSCRNLISNIHSRGTTPEQAVYQIAELAARMMRRQISGVRLETVPILDDAR